MLKRDENCKWIFLYQILFMPNIFEISIATNIFSILCVPINLILVQSKICWFRFFIDNKIIFQVVICFFIIKALNPIELILVNIFFL